MSLLKERTAAYSPEDWSRWHDTVLRSSNACYGFGLSPESTRELACARANIRRALRVRTPTAEIDLLVVNLILTHRTWKIEL